MQKPEHEKPYIDPDGDICVLARQLNRSQEEIDRLQQTLLKYGRHTHDCQMYGLHQCTCGWMGEYLNLGNAIRAASQSDAGTKP
jgi:hypothetical protein